jgi:hypothetical protein
MPFVLQLRLLAGRYLSDGFVARCVTLHAGAGRRWPEQKRELMKPTDLNDIEKVLIEASKITNHRHFVIAGSLSIIGAIIFPPDEMCFSRDVDMYPKFDLARAGEIAAAIGVDSAFSREHGVYADAISPVLLSLPPLWENRLIQIPLPSGVTGWFLDPVDAAISKLVRGEPRDVSWVKAGLQCGIISERVFRDRLPFVSNVLDGEVEETLRRFNRLTGKTRGDAPKC